MKYALIEEHRESHGVAVLCRVLQVSRSGILGSSISGWAIGILCALAQGDNDEKTPT